MNLQPSLKVAFFGDSVCVGQGISVTDGWVTQVAVHLNKFGQAFGRSIIVSNSSVNGRTTRQALEDMPYHVQEQDIDLLVIQFGLNDCNYWLSDNGLPRVSPLAYVANMLEIIDRAFVSGIRRVVVNSNHPTSRTIKISPNSTLTYEENNERYYGLLLDSVKNYRPELTFVDVRDHFLKIAAHAGNSLETLLLDDGLHLSMTGHKAYFDLLAPVIQRNLHDLVR